MSGWVVFPIVQTTVPARIAVPSSSSTPPSVTALGPRLETDFDAAGRHSSAGIFAQLLGQLRQDSVNRLE